MRYDWLETETEEEPPCGPDLELSDPEYFNFILTAEGFLPGSFFSFDRATINLKEQTEKIAEYLKQCRDIRLLCLEAKFRILFGQFAEFCECLISIDYLLKTHWEDVYPRGEDGDFFLRSGAVAVLEDIPTAILPVEYAPLVTDRRHGPVSFRSYRVAIGEANSREGEAELDAGTITETLANADYNDEVEKLLDLSSRAVSSLSSIRSSFIDAAGYEQAPSYDGLVKALEGVRDLLTTARPDLARSDDPEEDSEEGGAEDGEGEGDGTGGGEGTVTVAAGQTVTVAGAEIANKSQAKAALGAAAGYFASKEPSNPAMILVHQAQSLVGKSIVEAMQILVPGSVDGARLKVLADKELQLNIEQMRSLSSEALQMSETENNPEAGTEQDNAKFSASSRPEAVALIRGVEQFFRSNEPSSPVPMLLSRARQYLNMDFEVILADLLPKPESE